MHCPGLTDPAALLHAAPLRTSGIGSCFRIILPLDHPPPGEDDEVEDLDTVLPSALSADSAEVLDTHVPSPRTATAPAVAGAQDAATAGQRPFRVSGIGAPAAAFHKSPSAASLRSERRSPVLVAVGSKSLKVRLITCCQKLQPAGNADRSL